jgi:hypothetical protein
LGISTTSDAHFKSLLLRLRMALDKVGCGSRLGVEWRKKMTTLKIVLFLNPISQQHGRMARGGHGLPKVSLPLYALQVAIPETALLPFQGWPAHRAGSLRPSCTPLVTPRRTPLPSTHQEKETWRAKVYAPSDVTDLTDGRQRDECIYWLGWILCKYHFSSGESTGTFVSLFIMLKLLLLIDNY